MLLFLCFVMFLPCRVQVFYISVLWIAISSSVVYVVVYVVVFWERSSSQFLLFLSWYVIDAFQYSFSFPRKMLKTY